jgi:tetratricopeptide (TPR) repeat protein
MTWTRFRHAQGELDTAQDWYRKSLAISEELGDRPGMAQTYGQSGLLTEQQGQLAEALAWTVRCVSLFDEIPHPSTGRGPWHLARLTSQRRAAANTSLPISLNNLGSQPPEETSQDPLPGRWAATMFSTPT